MIRIDHRELDRFTERLATLAGRPLLQAEARVAYQRGLRIMEVAQRLVPVDTGALRSSGTVEPPDVEGNKVTVRLGFGGVAAPYAFYVHEDLDAFHPVGQAKYLEEPFLAERAGMLDEFRKATVEFMREQLRSRSAA